MDTETTVALMAAQLDKIRASALRRAFGWEITVDGLTAYVPLRPRKRKQQEFLLRAVFDDYPRRAPSCVFVDVGTRQHADSAWPPGVRHGANPPGICTPGTREFHEAFHLNDGQYPWDPDRFPFLKTLTEIHRIMERGIGD